MAKKSARKRTVEASVKGVIAGLERVFLFEHGGKAIVNLEDSLHVLWGFDIVAFIEWLKRPEVTKEFPEIAAALNGETKGV